MPGGGGGAGGGGEGPIYFYAGGSGGEELTPHLVCSFTQVLSLSLRHLWDYKYFGILERCAGSESLGRPTQIL